MKCLEKGKESDVLNVEVQRYGRMEFVTLNEEKINVTSAGHAALGSASLLLTAK